jgi:hypothetical protein
LSGVAGICGRDTIFAQKGMPKLTQWFKSRYRELDLLEQYFPLLSVRWQSVIWGGGVLAIGWGLRFIVGEWPTWVNWLAVVVALFFAGYYVWRDDHIRLLPKLVIGRWNTLKTRVSDGSESTYVQVLVECGSEHSVDDCRGHIKHVSKWDDSDKSWEPLIDQSLPLLWSNIDQPSRTLWSELAEPLNVFYINNFTGLIMLCSEKVPFWMTDALSGLTSEDILKFEILVTAKDCAPVTTVITIGITENSHGLAIVFKDKASFG